MPGCRRCRRLSSRAKQKRTPKRRTSLTANAPVFCSACLGSSRVARKPSVGIIHGMTALVRRVWQQDSCCRAWPCRSSITSWKSISNRCRAAARLRWTLRRCTHDNRTWFAADGGSVRSALALARAGILGQPCWYLFTAFVGLNLLQSAFTNWCPEMWILAKFGLKPAGGV